MRIHFRKPGPSSLSLLYDEFQLPKAIRRSLNLILNLFGNLHGIICGGGTTAMVGLANELHAGDLAFGLSASPDEARPSYIAVFACITSLIGVALGTLCGGALLESWENAGWFAGKQDRLQILVILGVVLRLLVTFLLVPPLENDRDGTPGQMVSAIFRRVIPARYRK